MNKKNEFTLVTVVITTRNESCNICNCLESVKKQTYPQDKIEIIVVDNNSIDNTKELACRYTEKVYNWGPERSAQRNFGVRKGAGKYILYLDADMILSENLIFECVEKCEVEGRGALYVPEIIIGKGFWIRVRDFERSFYNATCIDCVRFINREKFIEIGGFDESLTGPEDWDLDRRITEKAKSGVSNSVLYHNEGEFNLSRYLEKKFYYSGTFKRYIDKWGQDDAIVRKQLGFYYRFIGVFTENSRWEKSIAHPILLSGMYLLRSFIGWGYLVHRILEKKHART